MQSFGMSGRSDDSHLTWKAELGGEIKKIGPDLNGHRVLLRVNPDIARALKEEESAIFRDLQQMLGKPITLRPDAHLHHEQFDVMAI